MSVLTAPLRQGFIVQQSEDDAVATATVAAVVGVSHVLLGIKAHYDGAEPAGWTPITVNVGAFSFTLRHDFSTGEMDVQLPVPLHTQRNESISVSFPASGTPGSLGYISVEVISNAEAPPSVAQLGPLAWYDASQITGLSDSDPVVTWLDVSGNGYDLTQPTPGDRPIYRANAINGFPAVDFPGRFLSNTSFADFPDAVTVVAVANWDSAATDGVLVASTNNGTDGTGGFQFLIAFGFTHRARIITTGGTVDSNKDPIQYDAFHVFGHRWSAASGVLQHYIDGKSAAQGFSTDPFNHVINQLHVGARSGSGVSRFTGLLAELIIFDRRLTQQELESVFAYNAYKYAIHLG